MTPADARRRRTAVAAALSVGLGVGVPGVALLAGFSLGVLNPLRDIDTPTAAAAAAGQVTTGSASRGALPALRDLSAALTAGPSGSAGDGAVNPGAALPTSVSCVSAPITPVVTVGRGFTVGTEQVSVTLAAYVAGAGAAIFNNQFTGIPACAVPGGGSSVAAGAPDGPGTASFTVSTSQLGAVTQTVVWRRGDVLAYLSGADPATEAGIAGAMDVALQHALGTDCANEASLATDDVRDPFAVAERSDFKGLTIDEGINQSPTPLPSPSASVSPGPLGVTLPAPSVAATPSKPPWPVYPPLPSTVAVPVPPSAPSSLPPTHAPLREAQVDAVGPGCGWAFTGMLPPTPPTVLSAAALATKQAALQPLLARDQAQWQASVNAYWSAYTAYIGLAQGYAAYTDQVNQVAAAWAVIDDQWQAYFALKASYDQMIADRKTFLTAQAAAQQQYAANQASCTPTAAAPDPAAPVSAAPMVVTAHARAADTPTATSSPGGLFPGPPTPSATASDPSAPTTAPSDTTAPAPGAPLPATTPPAAPAGTPCEAPPTILAETPPPTPTGPPPTKPADPRPSRAAKAGGSASATPSHP